MLLNAIWSAATAQTFREGVNVFFSRAEKIKKVQPAVFARLANAQQDKVIANGGLGEASSNDVTQLGKRPDCMFCIVVVPWNAVIVQKREKLIPISFEPLLTFSCPFTSAIQFR